MNHFASKRFHIRPLQASDAAAVFAYRSNPEVVRYQMWRPEGQRDVVRFIRELRGLAPGMPGIWFQFGIIEQSTGTIAGDCGVHIPIDKPDSVEVGLTLRQEYQGKGYATEVLQALIRFSFETLHVHRVLARTHPENQRSLSLIQRCNFSALPPQSGEEDLFFELRYPAWKSLTGDEAAE